MRFSYQKIIDVKERLKEEKERKIKELVEELERIEKRLRDTEDKIYENHGRLLNSMNGNDFSVLAEYLSFLENTKENLKKDKKDVEMKIDKIRLELVELLKEVKILENIKSRRIKAYIKEKERKVQKRIDQLSLRKKKNFP